jgi:hypothetical protein
MNVNLKVGATSTEIEVVADAAPLVESTASSIGTNFDVKAIEDLPLNGRDVSDLVNYVPGAANGIFNGERGASQTVTVDGVVANSSRGKDNGNHSPVLEVRLESVDEIVVQTDQLDLNQGFGQANMQAGFTTRRGGDKYHGRIYSDLRNSAFNAPSYYNAYLISKTGADAYSTLPHNHLWEWGPSAGGPIPIPGYKNRLFFFASYTYKSIPGSSPYQNAFPNASLQAGNYTYTGTDNASHTVNLLTLAQNQGLNHTLDPKMLANFAMINNAAKLGQTTADGGDPANITDLSFTYANNQTMYYPTFRIDYNATPNLRVNFAFNETHISQPQLNPAPYPGSDFTSNVGGNYSKTYTGSLGVEWTINPKLLNQLRGGYLYNYGGSIPLSGSAHLSDDVVWWNSPDNLNWNDNFNTSGMNHAGRITSFYPLGSLSDNLVWQHGSHNVTVGGSWYREQDHYWDNPQGYYNVVMNDFANGPYLIDGDPAISAFTSSTMPYSDATEQQNAGGFYGLVTGRLGFVGKSQAYDPSQKKYVDGKAVNLDELQQAFGFFAQDTWRIKPTLTFNYGIRWDFTGDDHDLQSDYHTASPQDLWGPSGFMNQFNPGSFENPNAHPAWTAKEHAYAPWKVSPQPAFGFSWTPSVKDGLLGKLAGDGKTVIRAGYALRNYTESYQNFWNYASDQGAFFYNSTQANAQNANGGPQPTGTFAPGTYTWSQESAALAVAKANYTTYQSTLTQESQTFNGANQGVRGMDPNIRQPYTQSWNLGIQRELSKSNAIEVRYVGNLGLREWIPLNPNEVNVFENGFLQEFKQAQQNLAAYTAANPGCAADGTCSFGNNGMANQVNLPIMTAAFGGDATQWSNGSFLYDLQNGDVGGFASNLTQASYFCKLAGNFTTPCVTNAGIGGGTGPYPMNLFQANPYVSNQGIGYLTSEGTSNYHSLQVEFRQKNFHGANFTANYTFAKNQGVRPIKGGDSTNFKLVTMRNMRLSYSPTDSDVRQTLNILGTYDLPFGKGKTFSTNNKVVNAVIGDWTWGTITTFKTGLPFQLTGGNTTYNDYADGGIVMSGVTLKQLRKSVGVYNIPGRSSKYIIDPKYLSTTYLKPNTTPGTLGARPWLWGPHSFNTDMSMAKVIPLKAGFKFSLQGEFLNATNHHSWGTSTVDSAVNDMGSSFGRVSGQSGASDGRVVEVRANIEF